MRFMKVFYFIILTIALVSCAGPSDTPIKVEREEYVITDFDPPKHVAIDITRISDGRQFHVRFGKHCNSWRDNVVIGEHKIFTRYTYTDGETDRVEFDDEEFRNCFCN